jgi:hypothetical protein
VALLAGACRGYLYDGAMLVTVDERVEMIMTVEEMARGYSIGYSCDFQRTKGAFQPRHMRKALAALVLRYDVWHYYMCPTASIPRCESTVVELHRDRVLEGEEEEENKVLSGIVAKEGLNDKSHMKADTELRAGNCRTMQSAGYRQDLRVEAAVAELGRHHSFLLGCNSQADHTRAKAGVARRTPDRRRDYMVDEHSRCGIWLDWYRLVECIAVASSAGGTEKGRRMIASQKAREPEAGVGILPEAPYRRTRDEWVYCVGWRVHPDHVLSQDCSFQRKCSVLLLRLPGLVPGRCQNKAHRHFHRSSELVGVGDQDTLAGNHMGHTGPVATVRDGLKVGRTVGRSNSLTWSSCRLLIRVVIGLARWSVAFIERQIWVTALTLAPSTVPRSHVRITQLQIVVLKSQAPHRAIFDPCWQRWWKSAVSCSLVRAIGLFGGNREGERWSCGPRFGMRFGPATTACCQKRLQCGKAELQAGLGWLLLEARSPQRLV